jgi:hypothetical protein
MFRRERNVRVAVFVVFIIGLFGVGETFAQNGAIINAGTVPVVVTPGLDVPNYPDITISTFGIPFQPTVVQPANPVVPTVNGNAKGDSDPNGIPYRNLTANPVTNPNVVTPGVSPYAIITVPIQTVPSQ